MEVFKTEREEISASEVPEDIIWKVESVSLKNGDIVNLTKSTNCVDFLVGIGWNAKNNFDLDSAAFLVGADYKVTSDADFIFYNNLKHYSNSVEHLGENLKVVGDNEEFKINLSKIPESIRRICFTISIYESELRNQNFGQVKNIFIRVINSATKETLIHYMPEKNFFIENSILIGEFFKLNGEWKFKAIGSGYSGGLLSLCRSFGVNL